MSSGSVGFVGQPTVGPVALKVVTSASSVVPLTPS